MLRPVLVLLLLTAAACGGGAGQAVESRTQALVIDAVVTTTSDVIAADGLCSLREAVRAGAGLGTPGSGECPIASTGDTLRVILGSGTYSLSIPGTGENAGATGDLDLPARGIEISGAGKDATIIDGNSIDRVFHQSGNAAGSSTILRDFEVREGCANAGTCESFTTVNAGGGFYFNPSNNSGAQLQIERLRFAANHGSGGGGLAICATGQLGQISVVSTDFASNLGGLAGGGVEAHVVWTCDSCTFSNNTAIRGGGLSQYAQEATLLNPAFSGNVATTNQGGGIIARGIWGGGASRVVVIGGTMLGDKAGGSGGEVHAGTLSANETCTGSGCEVILTDVVLSAGRADDPTGGIVGSGGVVAQIAGGRIEARGSTSITGGTDLSAPYAPDCSGELHLYDQSVLGQALGCTVLDHRPPPGPVCGNSVVETGEDCDGTPCCEPDCVFSLLGTSCDDEDVCTPDDTCDGAGACVPDGSSCGDGVVQTQCGEACDDGGATSHDGCSETCLVEMCITWE